MVVVIMRWAKQQIKFIEDPIIMSAVSIMVGLSMSVRDDIPDQGVVVMMLDGEPPSWMSPYGGEKSQQRHQHHGRSSQRLPQPSRPFRSRLP